MVRQHRTSPRGQDNPRRASAGSEPPDNARPPAAHVPGRGRRLRTRPRLPAPHPPPHARRSRCAMKCARNISPPPPTHKAFSTKGALLNRLNLFQKRRIFPLARQAMPGPSYPSGQRCASAAGKRQVPPPLPCPPRRKGPTPCPRPAHSSYIFVLTFLHKNRFPPDPNVTPSLFFSNSKSATLRIPDLS